MKVFFFATFAALIALSFIAAQTRPKPVDPSRTRLVWTSDDNPLRREQLEPFNAMHANLHLVLDPSNVEIEKVMVQSLAGVGPDLFDCYSGFQLTAYVKAGIAWDVTDELAKMKIDIADTWPAVHPTAVLDGRAYGHPVNVAANALFFHRDVLKEVGIELPRGPWTWQQAVPVLQKLTKKDARGKTIRYGLLFDWENNYRQFIEQWGGSFYTSDGTRCALDSPQAIAAVQFMQDLVHKYHIAPDPAEEKGMAAAGGWGGASVITLFGAQRGATALGGRWWLSALRKPEYKDLELGVAEGPYGLKRVFAGYGKSTLINRNSPRRYEALKFLQYLATPQYNKLINHQADGLGAVKRFAYEQDYLFDPSYPEETDNVVWRNVMEAATPEQVSPFMNGAVLARLMLAQIDLVKAGDVTAEAAMKEAARRVNQRIEENLRQSPALRQEWERRVAAQGN